MPIGGGGGGGPPIPGLSGGKGGLPGPPRGGSGPGRPMGEGAGADLTLPPPTLRPEGGGGGRGPLEVKIKSNKLAGGTFNTLLSHTLHLKHLSSFLYGLHAAVIHFFIDLSSLFT